MAAAVKKADTELCKGMNVKIDGASQHSFIEKKDIVAMLTPYLGGDILSKRMLQVDLHAMERAIRRDTWVSNAELYFDNNGVLQVEVGERKPIARVFTNAGESFYIDSSCKVLPLSDRISVEVPLFTGFSGDQAMLKRSDIRLLRDIKTMSVAILQDNFLMAIIEQVDVLPTNAFDLYPKLGNLVIQFGNAKDCEEKFKKLKLFYKNILPKAGWNRYNKISLMYDNQVVARIRSKEDIISDSLRTMELMKRIAGYMEYMAGDTSLSPDNNFPTDLQDFSMVMNSFQRDDEDFPIDKKEDRTAPVIEKRQVPVMHNPEKSSNVTKVQHEVQRESFKKHEKKRIPNVDAKEKREKNPILKPKPKAVLKAREPAPTKHKNINNDY